MYSTHADDQSAFQQLGLSGDVDRASDGTDALSVVSENAAGNKGDWFLERDVSYRVRLDPARTRARAELSVTFRNHAPASGLPDYVIGSPRSGIPRGTNRQMVLLIRAPADYLEELIVGGAGASPQRFSESSMRAYRTSIDIPPRSDADVRFTSSVPGALTGSADKRVYRLRVLPQAVIHPDHYDIEIDVPRGWSADGNTRFVGDLKDDLTLELRLSRTARGWLIEHALLEPWRTVRAMWDRIF
jgi:hypothetical protein